MAETADFLVCQRVQPRFRSRGRPLAGAILALLAAVVPLATPTAAAPAQPVGDVQATVETTPVLSSGDAADDIAIWSHPTNPAASVVIGNDKGGALEVYDLSGARIQRIVDGQFGNVDVRKGFLTGTGRSDLVVTFRAGLRIYRIDPVTRQLSNITDATSGTIAIPSGEGLCLYRSPTSGSTYVYVNAQSGQVNQYRLTDADSDGLVEATSVRAWDVGAEIESCVADDQYGDFYVSEEDVGIWKYGAEPTDPTTPGSRVLVDSTGSGGHLVPDVEGLTIVQQPGGSGYLMASSQAASNTANRYVVYERQGTNAFIRSFQVVTGPAADGCGRTDGIDALAANLGPSFPHGIFVCQDNNNTAPAPTGYQNFKFVPLERVVGLAAASPAAPPISYVGRAASNANARNHTVTVPAAAAAGDGLLLFFGSNTTAAVPNPAGVTGWQAVDTLTGPSGVTRVWRKVAGAGDPGDAVTIAGSARTKANMVVVAYRGTSGVNPVAAFARAAGAVGTTSHVTPTVSVTDADSWAVSYWNHEDSTTTALTPPGGVTVRASGTQTGTERVTGLLADSGAAVPTGPYGGLRATASAGATNATMWTIILAPA